MGLTFWFTEGKIFATTPMMKALLSRLGTNWMLAAFVLAAFAYRVAIAAVAVHAIGEINTTARLPDFSRLGIFLWVMMAITLLASIGCVFRQRWAKWLAIVLLLWHAFSSGKSVVTKGWQWSSGLTALGLPMVAWSLWKRPNANCFTDKEPSVPSPGGSEDPKKTEFPSMVQLRTKQRYLESVIVAEALSSAWNLKLVVEREGERNEDDDESSDGFVMGESPHIHVLLMKPPMTMFIVHNLPHPFWEDSVGLAKNVPNLRYAQAVEQHQAYLSVDCVHWAGETPNAQETIYQYIGKAMSALADDDVLAVLCPEKNQFNLWSEDLEPILSGPNPFAIFDTEVKAAVIQVPASDTESAMQQARERWPEFVEAFKQRESEEDIFLAKAHFEGEDGGEYMWLKVFGMEPEYVHGHLINEPMRRTKLRNGSQVEVPVGEICDWVCQGPDGKPMGNFTNEAIRRAVSGQHISEQTSADG